MKIYKITEASDYCGGWTEDERRKRHWMHLPPLNSPIDVTSCNELQNFPQPGVRRKLAKGNPNG